MKKLLGIVVLGFLLFANTAKSEVIELENCFRVKHSEWHLTKVYNLKDRYEESIWSINRPTGLITQIEIWSESYRDSYYKQYKEVLPKEEFIEFQMTTYTSNRIIGRSYIDDPVAREFFFNPNDIVIKEEVRINLNDKTVKLIENPTGSKYRSYNKVKKYFNFSYEEFLERYEPRFWDYYCEKISGTKKIREQ